MKKIAVLVSGGGTNLQALIDAQRDGRIRGGEIAAVIASKDGAFALTRAKDAGIAGYVVSRKAFDTREAFTDAVVDKLLALGIDLVVLAGFLYILSPRFVETFPNRVINVHPALIPAFCGDGYYGLRMHKAALDYGVKLTGATVHFVSEETDGGPIILQKCVVVRQDDTPETLQRRVMEQAEWTLLPEAVSLFCEDRLTVTGRQVLIEERKAP